MSGVAYLIAIKFKSVFGIEALAYLAGVDKTKVSEWLELRLGSKGFTNEVVRRMLLALEIVDGFSRRNVSEPVARAWFEASRPELDDLSPLQFLKERPFEEAEVVLWNLTKAGIDYEKI